MSENQNSETTQEVTPGNGPAPVTPAAPVEPPKVETQNSGNLDLGTLVNAIGALPEKIVDSLRESMQPANPSSGTASQTTAQPANAGGSVSNSAPTGHAVPGKKTFTEWWFGK